MSATIPPTQCTLLRRHQWRKEIISELLSRQSFHGWQQPTCLLFCIIILTNNYECLNPSFKSIEVIGLWNNSIFLKNVLIVVITQELVWSQLCSKIFLTLKTVKHHCTKLSFEISTTFFFLQGELFEYRKWESNVQ